MTFLRALLRRETAAPMLALTFASAVCVALVAGRVVWTRNIRYAFLVWNLFLAWLPLVFALLAQESSGRRPLLKWRLVFWAGSWLLFFPNAPYIFTDLVHLTRRYATHFWVDLMLILSCALTGLILGFVSLYLMQGMVRRLAGSFVSWLFVAAVAVLSAGGVWLGRFRRINSWDVAFRPITLYHDLGNGADNPVRDRASLAFAVLFATFLFLAYLMLWALTHLRHVAPPPPPPPADAKDTRGAAMPSVT